MAFHSNEVIAVDTTVMELTIPDGYPSSAVVVVEEAPIRVTLHGVDPDNGDKNGIRLEAGTVFEIAGSRDLANFRAIKADTDAASISVNYQQKD